MLCTDTNMTDTGAVATGPLLDEPKDQVGIYNRDALKKILKFSPAELFAGLLLLVSRWETGDIEIEDMVNKCKRKLQNKSEAQLAQDYLKSRNEYKYSVDVSDERKEDVYRTLVELGAPVHFTIVASHRRAIKRTAEILVECGAIPEMLPQYLRHDLSKYGRFEVIGYSVMFGSVKVQEIDDVTLGSKSKVQELDSFALKQWIKSRDSHYRNNRHHPEFWENNDMAEDALIESVIDMLACRLERDFKWREEPPDFCNGNDKNNDQYKTRYTDRDQKKVYKLVDDYYKKVLTWYKNKRSGQVEPEVP